MGELGDVFDAAVADLRKRIAELEAELADLRKLATPADHMVYELEVTRKRAEEIQQALERTDYEWMNEVEYSDRILEDAVQMQQELFGEHSANMAQAKRITELKADLQYMVKQDADGPGNLEGYRELGSKLFATEKRAEKAEAERDENHHVIGDICQAIGRGYAGDLQIANCVAQLKAERDKALEVCRELIRWDTGWGKGISINPPLISQVIKQAQAVLND